MDPPALLDPILTTLHSYYQVPECLDLLDPDPYKNGEKSDHRIVVSRPINVIKNRSGREVRKVKFRPFPQSGMLKMKEWFIDQSWEEVSKAESSHEKAKVFQNILMEVLDQIYPEKIRMISSDDQPWISHRLKVMDRKRKRIFHTERRSEKWKKMNKLFKKEVKRAKAQFYKNTIADLKQKNPGQWYSCLKRITSHDQMNQQINIEEISHLPDQEQAEIIADKFSSIPNLYQPLKTEDVSVPPFSAKDVPQFKPSQVWLLLTQLKTNKSTVPGDFPAKLIKQFAAYIAEPLADIINTSVRWGEYPKMYKYEVCTPVPKSFPTQTTS